MHEPDPFSSSAVELRAEGCALGAEDGEALYAHRARGDARARVQETWSAVRDTVQDAVEQMGDAAQRAAAYLRSHRSAEITADAIRVARERPAQTLVGAAALGFLVGALLSALGRR